MGYLTEDNGKIFKTTNRGIDWIEQTTGTTDFLNSISFLDKNTGWAVGMNDGIVIKTSNGGSTWNTAASGFAINLLDIQFITKQIGWIVGYSGQILKSTNGGINWTTQNSNTTANLWSVFFLTTDIGFAVGDSVILKTIDGGNNWIISYKTAEGKILDSFKSVFFVDNNYGYAVGVDWQTAETIIFHTEDGGESWIKQISGLNGLRLQSVMFTNKSVGWAVGENGNILSTTDGGGHWVLEQSGVTDYLRAVYAIDSSNVYAVGENATIVTNSKLLNLTMNWDENTANFQVGSMQQITWESENVENINIEYSTDAGKNWIIIEENYPAAVRYYDWIIPNTSSIYCKIKITDYSNSSIVDISPSTLPSRVAGIEYKWYFSIYGDNKWEQVVSPTTTTLTGIKFLDNYNGIAWGPRVLLETTNGGIDWQVRSTFSSKKSSFVDKNNGWIIIDKYQGYDSSVILYTSDGGTNWKKQYSINTAGEYDREIHLRDICFIDDKNGWKLVVSTWLMYGYLIPTNNISKTTDGGESWEYISSEFTSGGTNLNYIKFIDTDIGWCEGHLMDDPHDSYTSSTKLFFTTDGGNSWSSNHYSYGRISAYEYSGFYYQSNEWISRKISDIDDQNRPNIILDKNGEKLYEATNRGPKLLYFKNSDLGWFLGESYPNFYQLPGEFSISNRFICMTRDGGTTWGIQKFDLFENFPKVNEFFTLDGNVCWAVGDNGLILRYGDINPSEHYLINYEIILPNCENPENPLVVEKGNFSEGQIIKFPEYQLPTQYGLYQPYYNALVGTELGIPEGSLNEDIKIVINLEGVCQNGLIDNPDTQGIIELLFLNIEIIGDTSGTHSPLEYYYFNNDKEAYFKIPLANIDPLMELLNYDKDLLFPFFTLNGLNPDFNGIRKEIDSAYYTIFTKHFSELKLGIINSPNSIYTDMSKLPTEYKLEQNYPNPFNPTTKIAFSLPYETELRIVLYNMLGESVRTIAEGKFNAGFYQVNLMVNDLPSGIYVYRLESKEFISTKKLTLLK